MTQHCLSLVHLQSLKPLHDILVADIPYFGPDLKPAGVRYTSIGGAKGKFAQIVISVNSRIWVQTKRESFELKDYLKHNSLLSLSMLVYITKQLGH